jgi:hypothetical protein
MKNLTIGLLMGLLYMSLEVFFRWIHGDMLGWNGISWASMAGWTSIWMLPIGGACGVCVGYLNEWRWSRWMRVTGAALIGVAIILTIELLVGLVLNTWLNLHVWDYSDKWGNWLGLICVENSIAYFLMCPFIFWLDDVIKHYLYAVKQPQRLGKYYAAFFTFKTFPVPLP